MKSRRLILTRLCVVDFNFFTFFLQYRDMLGTPFYFFLPFRCNSIFIYVIRLQANYIEAIRVHLAQVCFFLFMLRQALDASHKLEAIYN